MSKQEWGTLAMLLAKAAIELGSGTDDSETFASAFDVAIKYEHTQNV